jgi:hypothetical protein
LNVGIKLFARGGGVFGACNLRYIEEELVLLVSIDGREG